MRALSGGPNTGSGVGNHHRDTDSIMAPSTKKWSRADPGSQRWVSHGAEILDNPLLTQPSNADSVVAQ